jgi:hypothetical protein
MLARRSVNFKKFIRAMQGQGTAAEHERICRAACGGFDAASKGGAGGSKNGKVDKK